ncbi:MAG: hypothetical protein ABI670_19635 [Chloroflexota bacterium]
MQERIPKTQAELADLLGVSLDFLHVLRREPSFMSELGLAMQEAVIDLVPELVGKHMGRIKEANPTDTRQMLEELGILRPRDAAMDGPKVIIGVDPEKI